MATMSKNYYQLGGSHDYVAFLRSTTFFRIAVVKRSIGR